MFDTGLVLRHKKNSNPYGLSKEDGRPLTRGETIGFFKLNNVNDAELMELNDYIKGDRANNTFYDNYWLEFDELGYGCNYIDGMRRSYAKLDGIYEENKSFTFPCIYEDIEWEGKIKNLICHQGYIEFSVLGRESLIKTYAGDTGNEIWACFPAYNCGCTLAEPSDIFWNSERLYRLFESIPDGITVANAIKILGSHIIKPKYEFDYDLSFDDNED